MDAGIITVVSALAAAYFLYWGDDPEDLAGLEARWQKQYCVGRDTGCRYAEAVLGRVAEVVEI
jgi:hypothetical protein